MTISGFYRKLLTQSVILLVVILVLSLLLSYLVSYQTLMDGTHDYVDQHVTMAMDQISNRFLRINSLLTLVGNTVDAGDEQEVMVDYPYLNAVMQNFHYLEGILLIRNRQVAHIRLSDQHALLHDWLPESTSAGLEEALYASWQKNRRDDGYVLTPLSLNGELTLVIFQALGRDGSDGYNVAILNQGLFENIVFFSPDNQLFFDGSESYWLGSALGPGDEKTMEWLSDQDLFKESWGIFGDKMYFLQPIRASQLSLVFSEDVYAILDGLGRLLTNVMIMAAIWVIALVIASAFFFAWLTKPIRVLQTDIADQVDSGFKAEISDKKMDELRTLWGQSISIRVAAFLYLMVASLLPVLVLIGYLVVGVRNLERVELGAGVSHAVTSTTNAITNRLMNYTNSIGYLADHPTLEEGLAQVNRSGSVLAYRDALNTEVVPGLSYEQDVLNITVIGSNNRMIYNVSQADRMVQEEETSLFAGGVAEPVEDVTLTLGEDVFQNRYLRFTTNVVDGNGDYQGLLMLDANLASFFNQISALEARYGSRSMMFCGNEEIVRSFPMAESAFATALKNLLNRSSGEVFIGARDYLFFNEDLGYGDCRLLTAVRLDQIQYLAVQPLLIRNLLLVALFVFVISIMAERFSYSVTRSIMRLQHAMGYAESGYFMTYQVPRTRDEIEQLGRDFNLMIKQIRQLIHDNQLAAIHEQEARINAIEAQYNAMQAQINPHFLHNVLETIHYMIVLEDSRAIKMVQLLGNLFRIGVGKGERFVKISQEVEHALLYTQIENIRFMNRFHVETDIEAAVADLFTVRFILQPVIENAIRYGLEMAQEDGLIMIKGWSEGNDVYLSISDNGSGMTPQRLAQVQQIIKGTSSAKSIGLQNVNQRIRMTFGEKYGIHLESNPNEGTKVVVHLPKLTTHQQFEEWVAT
jgi:sensor histidine kinase YesM